MKCLRILLISLLLQPSKSFIAATPSTNVLVLSSYLDGLNGDSKNKRGPKSNYIKGSGSVGQSYLDTVGSRIEPQSAPTEAYPSLPTQPSTTPQQANVPDPLIPNPHNGENNIKVLEENIAMLELEDRLSAIEQRHQLQNMAPYNPGGSLQKPIAPKRYTNKQSSKWVQPTPVKIQGTSLKTFSFSSALVGRAQITLTTEGRPLDAELSLWQGPDNMPQKMRVYVENGALSPFSVLMETPGNPNTVAVRNMAQGEFPFNAFVLGDLDQSSPLSYAKMNEMETPRKIQGGALRTFTFDQKVASVKVLLITDGRPLSTRIELLQGPNNKKQVVELYSEDGKERPFFAIFETPGAGTVIRLLNTATVEYPLTAWVEAHLMDTSAIADTTPVLGGDPEEVNQW